MNLLDKLYAARPEMYVSGDQYSGDYGVKIPVGPLTIKAGGYYDAQNNRFTEYELMRAIPLMGGQLNVGYRAPIDNSYPAEYLFGYNRRF